MSRAALRRRLAALAAVIRPVDSVEARVAALTPVQQRRFREWRADRAAWLARHSDGEAYALLLDGEPGPECPLLIRRAVFGTVPQLTEATTIAKAAEQYQRMMENAQ
ncbi:hypothetical protein D9601_12175 [Sphingomonas sp. MA1305]|nr:hypothetical protein [Sphingomonas sp. MA1305]